jgi:hypothetical protein
MFDRQNMTFKISWTGGGSFEGSISGNTADFAIAGHWSNGQSGALRIFRRRPGAGSSAWPQSAGAPARPPGEPRNT